MQSLRGQLWKTFLNIEKKRKPGVYDRLVTKALRKPFSGKVCLTLVMRQFIDTELNM